jgi:hypothetical protein
MCSASSDMTCSLDEVNIPRVEILVCRGRV